MSDPAARDGLLPARRQGGRDVLSLGWMAVMVILLPLMFMLFLRNQAPLPKLPKGPAAAAVARKLPPLRKSTLQQQNTALTIAIVLEFAALLALLGPNLLRPRCRTFPLVVAGAATLLIGAVVWNRLFVANFQITGFKCDIFRIIHRNPHAPMYGRVSQPQSAAALLPIGLAAALALYLCSNPLKRLESRSLPWVLLLFQASITVSFAWCAADASKSATIFNSAHNFTELDPGEFGDSVPQLLKRYVDHMPFLEPKLQHYPPGLVVIQQLATPTGIPNLARILMIALPVLTLLPLWGLLVELDVGRRATGAALVLLATSASTLIYPSVSNTCQTTFFAMMAIWLLVRGINRGEIWAAAGLGAAAAVYFFCSFAFYMVGLLMGMLVIFALVTRAVRPSRVASTAAVSLGVAAGLFALLYWTSGFNIVACFRMGMKLHLKQSGPGWDRWDRYLFRATGGILAYLISVGFAISVLAYAAVWPNRQRSASKLLRPFILATTLAIILAGFSGMSFLETERIWLFFSAPLAAVAGVELARRLRQEGSLIFVGVLVLSLVFACWYQLYFEHSFGPRPTRARPAAVDQGNDGDPATDNQRYPTGSGIGVSMGLRQS